MTDIVWRPKIQPDSVLSVEMIQNAIEYLKTQPVYRQPCYLITPDEMKLVKLEAEKMKQTIDYTAMRLAAEGRILPIPMN